MDRAFFDVRQAWRVSAGTRRGNREAKAEREVTRGCESPGGPGGWEPLAERQP